MKEDAALLREYVRNRSESAFAELVNRHLGLVFSVALRQVRGDSHLAEDISQQVFTQLAAKAAPLSHHPVLGGWLYRTTRYLAIDALRREQRRHRHEKEAAPLNETNLSASPPADPDRLRPVLDEAIAALSPRDRDAVVLRFFENRSFADIGTRLRLTENASRMRVSRALDKLQGLLARRGITSSAAALGSTLGQQIATAAPAGLASSIATAAVASATTAATGSILLLPVMSKITTGISAALILATATVYLRQSHANTILDQQLTALQSTARELDSVRSENRRLAALADEVASYRGDDTALTQLQQQAQNRIQDLPSAPTPSDPSPLQGPVYALKDLDIQPKVTSQSLPQNSLELVRAHQTGGAIVSFVVDTQGHTRDASVVSADFPALGEMAVETVKDWTFEPGQKGGAPVNVRMEVPINLFTGGSQSTDGPRVWVGLP